MGYGGSLADADVDAIIDGLLGGDDKTLSDLATQIDEVKTLLTGIKSQTDQLTFYGDELAVSGMIM